jgi:hypothetical protein
MSDEDEGQKVLRRAEDARYFCCGDDGIVREHIYLDGKPPPRGAVQAKRWKLVSTVAHSTQHAEIIPADLGGMRIGDAFVKTVIKDPKVQAHGEWLCAHYPDQGALFREGVFSGIQDKSPHGLPLILGGTKWPVVLNADELSWNLWRAASRGTWLDYPPPPQTETNLFFHTAYAIADCHEAFFDLLRGTELIAEAISSDMLSKQGVPSDLWGETDLYLDIARNTLLRGEHTRSGFSLTPVLRTLTLKRPVHNVVPEPKRKRIPKKKAQVIAALKEHDITSTAELSKHTQAQLAAALADEIPGWGSTAERVEALRAMLKRIGDGDFLACREASPKN